MQSNHVKRSLSISIKGELLWEGTSDFLNFGWNIYSPATIPDLDYDGVGEVLISHGGDPTVPAEVNIL